MQSVLPVKGVCVFHICYGGGLDTSLATLKPKQRWSPCCGENMLEMDDRCSND